MPRELWWIVQAKQPPKMYGSLTENEVAELVGELREMGYMTHGG